MNGKYMRQAEIRWASREAKRLEHIRKKREKTAKHVSLQPIKAHIEGDLYDNAGNVDGNFCGVITFKAKKGAEQDDAGSMSGRI